MSVDVTCRHMHVNVQRSNFQVLRVWCKLHASTDPDGKGLAAPALRRDRRVAAAYGDAKMSSKRSKTTTTVRRRRSAFILIPLRVGGHDTVTETVEDARI